MPFVVDDLSAHDLVERCKAGESIKGIANSLGLCDRTVSEALHRVGFRVNEFARQRAAELCRPLHADHMAG